MLAISFDGRTCVLTKERGKPRFTAWLREAMEARNLKLRQTAEYAEVSTSALSTILRGEGGPSYETARKLALYFHADVTKVLALAGYVADESSSPSADEDDIDLEDPELNLQLKLAAKELSPEARKSLLDYVRWTIQRERAERERDHKPD